MRGDVLNLEAQLADAEETLVKLRKNVNTARVRTSRALTKEEVAVSQAKTYRLKEKGVFKEVSREMFRDLVSECGVPVCNVNGVIDTVASGLGIEVQDSVDDRTVRRVMHEGLIASEIQLASGVHGSECELTQCLLFREQYAHSYQLKLLPSAVMVLRINT